MAKKLAVFDFETDPFLFGRVPEPFAWGFYDGENYIHCWGSEGAALELKHSKSIDAKRKLIAQRCIDQLKEFLENSQDEYLIYAHNGGKFDFMFFLSHFEKSLRIVNGRILEASWGKHVFRDSYAILPIPLAEYEKDVIDYKLMELNERDKHKQEILDYLKTDCLALHKLVSAFVGEFGDVLTIGSAAMKEFKKFHKFEQANKGFDLFFRKFYYGGRCQCFETGMIKPHKNKKIHEMDVHSMYPSVMDDSLHPISLRNKLGSRVSKKTAFVCWQGKNFNAVPARTKKGLDFTLEHSRYTNENEFFTTVHEFNAGLETGTIKPERLKYTVDFHEQIKFSEFVNHFYESRMIAKQQGDIFHTIFYKLILNSSYGKQAQDSSDFKDNIILPYGEIPELILLSDGVTQAPPEKQWMLEYQHNNYAIWSKPADRHSYYNVAIAASITGAARAKLLLGLSKATRPLYCDTDSIFCESFSGQTDDKKLGTWGLGKSGDLMAIAGKKLYALMDNDVCVKKASKGVRLGFEDIVKIAQGETVECKIDAPAFKLDGNHQFISRRIRRT